MKVLLGLVVLAMTCAIIAGQEITNTKVQRTIDLTSQFARHTLSITAESKSAASSYLVAVQNATHLAFIKAEETEGGKELEVKLKETKGEEATYEVAVRIEGGKSAAFKVVLIYTASLEPFPTHISQGQKQLVRYYSNAHFYSPYTTSHQRTTVKLPSSTIEGHSETAPTKVSGDTLTYGAYDNVKAFSSAPLWVHFENNSPFLTITKMVKEYEVSHWGNLAVEQWLDIRHTGAALKGHFSRFDFQRNPGATPAAVLQITEILPLETTDVYYRDDIGNISTSSFSVSSKGLEFHVVPRFPLFGGWKNNWYTGYNLPLANYLSTDGGSSYRLNVSFASSMGNIAVDDYTVRVILPEGSKVTKISVPFDVKQHEEKHYTYLDTTGRTVVVLHKNNVVPEHNVPVQIEYQFSAMSKWFEPMLIAGGFFALLAGVMVYVRFHMSIKQVDNTKTFAKRDELIVALKSVVARIDGELTRQNAIAEKSTESSFKWTAKPLVLDELNKIANQASPFTTGESFSLRVKDFAEAEAARFKYQGKLHAVRFASGAKKTRVEKEKKVQDKLNAATETVQQFVEDWIAL